MSRNIRVSIPSMLSAPHIIAAMIAPEMPSAAGTSSTSIIEITAAQKAFLLFAHRPSADRSSTDSG
jgi:hypothetical protein